MRRYEHIWHKRQLVPCWILQCIASGVFAIAAGLILAAAAYVKRNDVELSTSYSYHGYSASQLVDYAAITGGVILGLALATIIFAVTECVLYARRVLNPVTLLVLASLKTLAWGAYFILSIVSAARGSVSWLDLLLSLVLTSTSLTQLVLGAKYTRQKRNGTLDNRGNYKSTITGHVEGGAQPAYHAGAQSYAQPHQPHKAFNDTVYRSTSPAPPTYPQGAQNGSYYGHEMQPPKPAAQY